MAFVKDNLTSDQITQNDSATLLLPSGKASRNGCILT